LLRRAGSNQDLAVMLGFSDLLKASSKTLK